MSNVTRVNITDSQSSRKTFIAQKNDEYVQKSEDSQSMSVLWTGRSDVEESHFRCHGKIFETHWPPEVVANLKILIQRSLRYYHPRWKAQSGDQEAVQLLKCLGSPAFQEQLEEHNSSGFFEWLEQEKVFGQGSAATAVIQQVKEAWVEYKGRLPTKKGKENAKPPKQATTSIPMERHKATVPLPMQQEAIASPLPMQQPMQQQPSTIHPPMQQHVASSPKAPTQALEDDWPSATLDALNEHGLFPVTEPTQELAAKVPRRRRPHTDVPGRFHNHGRSVT